MAGRDARLSATPTPSGGVRGSASSEEEDAAAEAYHAELAQPLGSPDDPQYLPLEEWDASDVASPAASHPSG
eukprot:10596099-Alexandrium_andersonii.AAC.1